MTSIEWLEKEIDEEIQVLSNLYGSEIKGRLIALHFAKRRCKQAKEMHKQEIIDAFSHTEIMSGEYFQVFDNAEEYYQETFKKD